MPQIRCNNISNISWNNPAAPAFDATRSVHVWRARVSSNPVLIGNLLAILNEEEQDKAFTYHQEKDRQRYVISHGALRLILGQYLGLGPAGIKFDIGSNKKPVIHRDMNTDLHYNVSHSGEWALIAVANHSIGADVEKTDTDFSFTEILPYCFNAAETAFINKAGKPREAFYQLWTRKETLVKATTKGIDNDMPSIPCLDGQHDTAPGIINSAEDWEVSSFEVEGGYIGCIGRLSHVQNVLFWEAGSFLEKLEA